MSKLSKFLVECLLESRIDSIKQSNPDIPESVIDHYNQHSLPDNNKAHLDWVIKQHKLGNITPDTAASLKPIVDTYIRNKSKLGKISNYDVNTLTNVTDGLHDANPTKNEIADKDTKTIYDSPTMRVQKHLSFESSNKGRRLSEKCSAYKQQGGLGNWCVGIEKHHFNDYTEHGDFHTIENKKTGTKTGMILNPTLNGRYPHKNYEVRDEYDDIIPPSEITKHHPDIKNVPELHDFFSKFSGYNLSNTNSSNELHNAIDSIKPDDLTGSMVDTVMRNKHYNSTHEAKLVDRIHDLGHAGSAIMQFLLNDKNISKDTIKKIGEHANQYEDENLFNSVVNHKKTDKEVLLHLISNSDNIQNTSQIPHKIRKDEDIHEAMLKSSNIEGASTSARITKKHINLALSNKNKAVRDEVLSNSNYTPNGTEIDSHIKTNNISNMINLSKNRNTPEHALIKIASHPEIIEHGLDNYPLDRIHDVDFLNSQYQNASLVGKASILKNENVSPDILKQGLHHDGTTLMIDAALNNPNTRKSDILDLKPHNYSWLMKDYITKKKQESR